LQIGEDGMSVLLLATWPAKEEREKERYFCGKCVEKCGIIGILENGNALACGGKKEIKEKEKWKRN